MKNTWFKSFLKNRNTHKALLFSALILLGREIQFENNYFAKNSLKLTTRQNSPAFAALEDVNQKYSEYKLKPKDIDFNIEPLIWGENKNLWVLQNFKMMKYTAQAKELNPLVVETHKIANEVLKEINPLARVIEAPAEVIADQQAQIKIKEIKDDDIHPERVAMANNLMQASHNSLKTKLFGAPVTKSRIDQVIEQEIKNVYQGPTSLLIAGNSIKPMSDPSKELASFSLDKNPKKQKRNYDKHFKNYVMRGSLQFATNVIEPMDTKNIKVYRSDTGEEIETAFVDLNKKYYEIHVKELAGFLIAEIYNKESEIIGYGEIDLLDLDLSQVDRKDIVINHNLKIATTSSLLSINAISGESTTTYEASLLAKNVNGTIKREQVEVSTEIDGLDDQIELDKYYNLTSDMFTADSNMLMKFQAKSYWGSLAIGLGHSNNKIRMYKNSLVNALLDNYKESHEGYGVVWGRVVDEEGNPIVGAKVELAGELATGPFYFNPAHLVDYQLNSTDYDGLFAFVKVLPGLQAARAIYNGKELPVELIVVDADNVSYVEIRLSKERHISVDSYNPITKNNVDTSYKLMGSDKVYEIVSNQKNIELWGGNKGISLIESDPGQGFELTRHIVQRKQIHHRLPVVATSWIESLYKQKSVNPMRNKGVVVGYINGDNFEVYANADLDGWSKRDIIYFDEKGRVLPKNLGRAGGGFVMYNVPENLSSVSVLARNSNKVFTSLVVTDRDYIAVINTDFN